MSFTINFMKNSDEINKINKSPETIITLTGTLKKETSIVNPVILIEYDGTFTNCNYAYIESFSRYSYITDIKNIREKLSLSLHSLKCSLKILIILKVSSLGKFNVYIILP